MFFSIFFLHQLFKEYKKKREKKRNEMCIKREEIKQMDLFARSILYGIN